MTQQPRKKTAVAKCGTIGKDLTTGEGQTTNWCRFSIAVESPAIPGDWNGEKQTEWYEASAFGSLATHAAESFLKGDRVLIIGKGEIETWTGRDNKERTSKRILADSVGPDVRFNSVQINRSDHRLSKSAGLTQADNSVESF